MHMCSFEELKGMFQKHKSQALQDFFSFLRFPSISSEPEFSSEVLACADWVAEYLSQIGFQTEKWSTNGHPTIFASNLSAGPSRPTLLIYHHYDVQPPGSSQAWISPPFEPTVRDGEVYARGAQDNKGQCFFTLLALKALMENSPTLPINIKLCIEGEEECGSMGLSRILSQKQEALKADYLVVVDVGLRKKNVPAVTLGARGLVAMDVSVNGSFTDLHSGFHGGLAFNPIHALVDLLSRLRAEDGTVKVPGFYTDVMPIEEGEKEKMILSFDEQDYREMFGISPSGGERKQFSPGERVAGRPTLEINGIEGGYYGVGLKTVIPAKAHAKISCRLVPNQDPKKIGALVARYLEAHTPEGISIKVNVHPGGGKAVRANVSSTVVLAFSHAFSQIFEKPCEFLYEGASIPIVTELAAASGSEVVLVGLGLPDDQIHAVNEHFGLDRIEKGFAIMIRAIQLLGQLRKKF